VTNLSPSDRLVELIPFLCFPHPLVFLSIQEKSKSEPLPTQETCAVLVQLSCTKRALCASAPKMPDTTFKADPVTHETLDASISCPALECWFFSASWMQEDYSPPCTPTLSFKRGPIYQFSVQIGKTSIRLPHHLGMLRSAVSHRRFLFFLVACPFINSRREGSS